MESTAGAEKTPRMFFVQARGIKRFSTSCRTNLAPLELPNFRRGALHIFKKSNFEKSTIFIFSNHLGGVLTRDNQNTNLAKIDFAFFFEIRTDIFLKNVLKFHLVSQLSIAMQFWFSQMQVVSDLST